MKNVLFIGHFLPNGRNVYETNLITELNKQVDHLEIVTINKNYTLLETTYKTIPVYAIKVFKKPIIDGILRFFKTIKLIKDWRRKAGKNDSRIILLNASLEINLAVLFASKLYKIKVCSLLIDTALGNFKADTLWNKYIYLCYALGEKIYKYLDASMALNEKVFQYLKLYKKPTHLTKIGYSSIHEYPSSKKENQKKRIIYTGSLIYYDGIEELLEAVLELKSSNIELLIFGSGPLSKNVELAASKCDHIKFMGYLSHEEIEKVLKDADFLINPRISYFFTDIFGFPSKMIEYLLSGTPVITTPFSAMPEPYNNFVYLIKEQTPTGIKDAIVKAISDSPEIQAKKAHDAYQYIKNNNNYMYIVREMVDFLFSF